MRSASRLTAVASIACLTFGFACPTFGQVVTNAVKFDVSPPLRSIPPRAKAEGAFLREHRVKKLPPLPTRAAIRRDTALQRTPTTPLPIGAVVSIPGIGFDTGYAIGGAPPDTNVSVGKTQLVEWVNTALAVFDKSTNKMVLG